MVRDPQFWKRFSVAVHQDDLEKTTQTQGLKQSYVSSSLSPPLGSPTSQTHLPITSPPMVQLQSTRSSYAGSSPLSPLSAEIFSSGIHTQTAEKEKETDKDKKKERPRSKLQKTPSTKPLLRPSISIQEFPSTTTQNAYQPPFSPLPSSPTHPHPSSSSRPHSFFRTPNLSTLSLSHLSGRPSSRFHFTTTITADASHRDSWLAGQQRKAKQRTWICWCFWICFLLLVAGVVVTIIILKQHKII
ncbi:uncharacterized protein J4E88_007244 [Alternaria novae-zelandiae]|uniref:uncharacterized protein n=1 Tax=Alternaria novae-zelandiae TaxID=430562 RepID=UPI0020C49708|nr:uncharacterized protein J4E88_007244 [Alternaria novae-zelandiae]KAI4676330.1 hypothetical protein J4E88_007244 [Alternaria novae-zelandiae]